MKSLGKNRLTLYDYHVFRQFVQPGEVTEVRIPKIFGRSKAWGDGFAKGTVSGYFDDHEKLCKALKEADETNHCGIYFTLQVIDPRLIGRAFNRLRPSDLTTSDQNVIAYRWLPIDIDPVRPSGISSSQTELGEACRLSKPVSQYIRKKMNFPSPITGMSGNGVHLLFRLPDIPVTEENKLFIKSTLEELADRFNTEKVMIDTAVFNPARIWKLYGTTSKKGDFVPVGKNREERPHRDSYIFSLGAEDNG